MERQVIPGVHPCQPQATPQPRCVRLLVWLDPATALRMVDIGPPADDAAAAKAFRAFWGDRAELRRFQVCFVCTYCLNRDVGPFSCNARAEQRHAQVSGWVLLGWTLACLCMLLMLHVLLRLFGNTASREAG